MGKMQRDKGQRGEREFSGCCRSILNLRSTQRRPNAQRWG